MAGSGHTASVDRGLGRIVPAKLAGLVVLLTVFASPAGAIAARPGVTPAVQASHRRARLPIRPRRGRPFVPALGNWEGVVEGHAASFELTYEPAYVAFRDSPYGYEDLVSFAPAYSPSAGACPVSTSSTGFGVVGEHDITPLGAGGVFPLAKQDIFGGVVATAVASLRERFVWPHEREFAACPAGFAWTLHPAPRREVRDGAWHVTIGGEVQTVTVSGGGRVLANLGFPTVPGCGAGTLGSVDLYIPGDGVVGYAEPASGTALTLTFSSPVSANGQFTVSTAECGARTLAISAALAKPAP